MDEVTSYGHAAVVSWLLLLLIILEPILIPILGIPQEPCNTMVNNFKAAHLSVLLPKAAIGSGDEFMDSFLGIHVKYVERRQKNFNKTVLVPQECSTYPSPSVMLFTKLIMHIDTHKVRLIPIIQSIALLELNNENENQSDQLDLLVYYFRQHPIIHQTRCPLDQYIMIL